jgi:hypothetical protein
MFRSGYGDRHQLILPSSRLSWTLFYVDIEDNDLSFFKSSADWWFLIIVCTFQCPEAW